MKTSLHILLVLGLIALAAGIGYFTSLTLKRTPAVTSYEDCIRAGYPVLESYPPQCRTPYGQNFTQDIGNELAKSDLIRVDNPRPDATITSPLMITGEARGSWFFEASFLVHLEDAAGNRLAITMAEAQREWMTTNFVPFRATLIVPPTMTGPATLVLERSNASGLPEHDDALRIPITIQRAS